MLFDSAERSHAPRTAPAAKTQRQYTEGEHAQYLERRHVLFQHFRVQVWVLVHQCVPHGVQPRARLACCGLQCAYQKFSKVSAVVYSL